MGFGSFADLAELTAAERPGSHDALLVDDRDPDHDAAICAVAAQGAHGQRAVFLLTAYQDLAGCTARCQARGYAGYLTKPIAHREVAQRLLALHSQEATPTDRRASEPRPATAPGAVRQLRILVAEDNPVNQKLIERILQRDGHAVTMADNGRICVDLFARQGFDLVLMDMQMPEMSGLEATAAIRREERRSGAHIPIIALTANTSIEDREACLLAGMDQVLAKPVSIPRLRSLLTQLGRDLPLPPGPATVDHDSPS
jgi:CheY-like chemotaxis protein